MKTPGIREDFLFSSLYSGTFAGGMVALAFIPIDALGRGLFFTPSLIGSVLFLAEAAENVSVVRLDMMALYTVIHVLSFVALGTLFTYVYRMARGPLCNPGVFAGFIFLTMAAGIAAINQFVFPGLAHVIGLPAILLSNALASGVMSWIIHASFTGKDLSLHLKWVLG